MGLDFSKIANKLSAVFSSSSKKITPETVKKLEGVVEGGTEKIQSSLDALAQNNKPFIKRPCVIIPSAKESSNLTPTQQKIRTLSLEAEIRASRFPFFSINDTIYTDGSISHFHGTSEPIKEAILKTAVEEGLEDGLNAQQALNGAKELLAAMGKRTNESARAAAKVFEEAGLTSAEIALNDAETKALNKLLEQ